MKHQVGLAATAVAETAGLDLCAEPLGRAEAALLEMADAGLDSRIALLSPGALEAACALMRRGHGEVVICRPQDRVQAGQADVVIVPHATSTAALDQALICGRRMLAPLGTIVLRIPAGFPSGSLQRAKRMLLLHGFVGVRTRHVEGEGLLRAELPLCGHVTCA